MKKVFLFLGGGLSSLFLVIVKTPPMLGWIIGTIVVTVFLFFFFKKQEKKSYFISRGLFIVALTSSLYFLVEDLAIKNALMAAGVGLGYLTLSFIIDVIILQDVKRRRKIEQQIRKDLQKSLILSQDPAIKELEQRVSFMQEKLRGAESLEACSNYEYLVRKAQDKLKKAKYLKSDGGVLSLTKFV
jgi:uncharacterized membrane protein YgaE (UPF0421/DUF939 family)